MSTLNRLLRRRTTKRPFAWLAVGVTAVPVLLPSHHLFGSQGTSATSDGRAEHSTASAAEDEDSQHSQRSHARISPNLTEIKSLTAKVLIIVLQLAVVLAAAKLLGWLCEAVNIPGVLGEVAAGMIIGPFALGQLLVVPTHHGVVPLFPAPVSVEQWPVSEVMWTIAVVASIVLLFVAGLHTNLGQFFANLAPATVCAIGGVIAPFFLGVWTTTWFLGGSMWDVPALFMGAIMVATSVGITARVLSDIHRLDTSEGVTILGGAVVDDVLGILVLAIVVGIKRGGGALSAGAVAAIALKAVGIWIAITAVALVCAPYIEWAFNRVRYPGARVGLGLALALLCSGIAEMFGLAFIIGAYSVGLGLSRTKMAHQLMEDLRSVSDFIVPIFFAVMGMLVNYSAMAAALWFGVVISIWGIVSKIFGCGLPALIWFRPRGAARIGMGMLPRGEVALIIAGVGLSAGAITQDIFGVAIMMTLVTTVIAPLGLVPLFRGRGGRRGVEEVPEEQLPEEPITIEMPGTVTRTFLDLLLVAFQEDGFDVTFQDEEAGICQLQKGDLVASIALRDGRVSVEAPRRAHDEVEAVVRQAERRLIAAVQQMHEIPPATPDAPAEGNPHSGARLGGPNPGPVD